MKDQWHRKLVGILLIIMILAFTINIVNEEVIKLKVKEYFKNLWNDLRYDEVGQYALGGLPWNTGLTGGLVGAAVAKNKPIQGQSYIPTTPIQEKSYIPTTPNTPSSAYSGITAGATTGAGVATGGGGGGVSSVSGFPTYTVPQISLNIPSFAWNPTEAQMADWQAKSANRANLIIDPQRQAEIEALQNFKADVARQVGQINPRYTKMSLAIANVVDNTIKQDIVDELIRRGATSSGELPRQLMEAGKYETEQRRDIENERNQLVSELEKQELERGTLSSERLAELEKLRGQQTAEELFQEEKYQREMTNAEKQALFQAELSKAQLIDAQQARAYESQYNKALLEAQLAQQEWERGQSERQLALQQSQAAYSNQAVANEVNRTIPVGIQGKTVMLTPYEYLAWQESNNSIFNIGTPATSGTSNFYTSPSTMSALTGVGAYLR